MPEDTASMAEKQTQEWLVDGIRMVAEADGTLGLYVTSPDFPEIVTCGDTVDEAVAMSRDALEAIVEWHIREGKKLPDAYKPEAA